MTGRNTRAPRSATAADVRASVASLRAQGMRPLAEHGTVYAIRSGVAGPVKIGFTTALDARLKQLQTGHPERLHVLRAVRGTRDDERAAHRRLAAHCTHGEWFAPHADVLAFVAAMADATPPATPAPTAPPRPVATTPSAPATAADARAALAHLAALRAKRDGDSR